MVERHLPASWASSNRLAGCSRKNTNLRTGHPEIDHYKMYEGVLITSDGCGSNYIEIQSCKLQGYKLFLEKNYASLMTERKSRVNELKGCQMDRSATNKLSKKGKQISRPCDEKKDNGTSNNKNDGQETGQRLTERIHN